MDVRALLHNRWALGGLGVAGAAGAYTLYKRKAAGTKPTTTGTAQASPGYSGSVGGFDSTGTDVAHWLGSYSGNLQNQLDAYSGSLSSAVTALQAIGANLPAGGTGAPAPTPAPPPAPTPAPTPPSPAPSRSFVTVAKYTTRNAPWNSTLSGIASHAGTSVANLLQLNPNITNPNRIYTNQQIWTS